ncbi:hypothetical protein JSE7799_02855 [Jannaschia seosinensis]|uniref:Uncharacterized protein n=1 Tax=Jannaschia seosinensis TaxID=313367 RepID=A0A0M7BFN0_9RHOB|nr:hypothetical protein JSE7799_02855 [Jannaschia seosinensis]
MARALVLVGADTTTIGVVESFDAGDRFIVQHAQIIHEHTSRCVIHFAAGP